jgi:ribosomal protein L37AE/L43A
MAERVIEAEVVEERIVACPQCRRSNRLYKRGATGVYKCGACRAALPNPFAAAKNAPSMRMIGIVSASLIALLVIIVVMARISSSPSPSESSEDSSLAAPAPETVLPVNNQIIFDAFPESTAKGEFTVINGASRHAIAKVIDVQTDTKILSFAICAGKHSKITAIPDGSYRVIFAFGDRLYAGTDRFEKPRGFSKFDRPFTFTTTTTATDTEDATYYRTRATALEVTLTPVIGGNITTSSISQKEFERY